MRRRLTGRKHPALALGTIAASSFLLAGCGGDPADSEVVFTSVDQCLTSDIGKQVCQAAYQDAMQTHLAAAPRFNGMAACEAEYGPGNCMEQQAVTPGSAMGTSSFVVPLLAGYVLSTAINNMTEYNAYRRRQDETNEGGGSYYGSAPVYRRRSGEMVTPEGRLGGNQPVTTSRGTKPVNLSTWTASRQGFGGRSFFSFGG